VGLAGFFPQSFGSVLRRCEIAERRVNVGVVGLGMGRAHIRSFRACSHNDIVAVCDIDECKAAETAEEFGIPRYYTNHEEMLALPELDAVVVVVPNHLHAPIAIDALQARKHVLCDKPMANDLDSAKMLYDAAVESKCKFLMGMNNRFRGDAAVLRRFIDEGDLGRIYYSKVQWTRRCGIPGMGGWFTTKDQAGGGPLIDLGVHMIDLALWLMGFPRPYSILGATYAEFGPKGKGGWTYSEPGGGCCDVEDLASGFIRFANGASMFVESSWAQHCEAEKIQVELYGSDGGATLEPLRVFKEEYEVPVDVAPDYEKITAHKALAAHFIDCILNDAEPLATAAEGLAVMRIIDAIYRSAETGKAIVVE
jgi:predicted dehydrogenase